MPPGSTCTTWAAPTAPSSTRRGCRPAPTAGCGWATGCASGAAPASSSCRWVGVRARTAPQRVRGGKGWPGSGSGVSPAPSGDRLVVGRFGSSPAPSWLFGSNIVGVCCRLCSEVWGCGFLLMCRECKRHFSPPALEGLSDSMMPQ